MPSCEFKVHLSQRTVGLNGQTDLVIEPCDDEPYLYLFCAEAGTFCVRDAPCGPDGDGAEIPWVLAGDGATPERAHLAAAKAKTLQTAMQTVHPESDQLLLLGPVSGIVRLGWQAPNQESQPGVDVKAYAADDQGLDEILSHHVLRPEVTPTPVPETFVRAIESLQSTGAPGVVSLKRPGTAQTVDQPLWVAIRNRTGALSFPNYRRFIDDLLCSREDPRTRLVPGGHPAVESLRGRRELVESAVAFHGVHAYEVLKLATQVFLVLHCGVAIDDGYDETAESSRLDGPVSLADMRDRLSAYLGDDLQRLPYLDMVLESSFSGENPITSPFCNGFLSNRLAPCLLELIWSYWHEEGGLVQSLAEISLRFQNKSPRAGRNPLANLEIDPLRPLNNLMWGYIEDERHRLSVPRRAYEYDHHYGLRLFGKAVPKMRTADSRSKFLSAFHRLLHRTALFYQEDADATVEADGFALINALQEVHMLLAEGAHNQYGDLPWTSRVEMLVQQWLLARSEMRGFLGGRAMVPYKEAWMGQVDTMKRLQGWTDTSVTHFHDLGVYGEQLLLSARYGNWVAVNDQAQAKAWARYWRPEVQGYIHAYQAVTGVDLGAGGARRETVDATLPGVHLRRRATRAGRGR